MGGFQNSFETCRNRGVGGHAMKLQYRAQHRGHVLVSAIRAERRVKVTGDWTFFFTGFWTGVLFVLWFLLG